MAWVTKIREQTGSKRDDAHKPFLKRLRDVREAMVAQGDDPWEPILRDLKGTVVGGIERIATFRVFELLGVPPRAQSSDIRRRLARRMVEHGWQPIRAHGLNERSFLTRVRGFSRLADHEGTPLLPPNTTKAGRRPQPLM
jgi:hypothetical protein